MSYVSEKTNSSNVTNEFDSEFKFNSYCKSIINKTNKMTNTFFRKKTRLNSVKPPTIISLNKKPEDISSYDSRNYKLEENKNSILSKNNRKNRLNKINMLFKNLLIREKQKTYRKNLVQINQYNMYIKEEQKNPQIIVNNNSSLLKTFLSQTRSNFNNKYKVIYSISDWKQKDKVKTLLNSIKKNQHKNNFSDFLKVKLLKKCSSSKMRLKKIDKNKNNNFEKVDSSQTSLINNFTNDYLKDILHKNNLIKIKTMNEIKSKPKPYQLRKSATDIFYRNNTFFKTMPMPIKKLKINKKNSFA